MLHTFKCKQTFRASQAELWEFISRPENLNKITPPEMNFEIKSDVPGEMYSGLMIEYRVKIPFMGKRTWLTEIKHIQPGVRFVDEQRIGPYSLWYHEHTLRPLTTPGSEGLVEMEDCIRYAPPFGILGDIVRPFLISPQLGKIFAYRKYAMAQLFEEVETLKPVEETQAAIKNK